MPLHEGVVPLYDCKRTQIFYLAVRFCVGAEIHGSIAQHASTSAHMCGGEACPPVMVGSGSAGFTWGSSAGHTWLHEKAMGEFANLQHGGPISQMNTLDALLGVCAKIGTPGEALLQAHRARQYAELVNGRSVASAGCEPILHMRAFQAAKALPEALVTDVLSCRHGGQRLPA